MVYDSISVISIRVNSFNDDDDNNNDKKVIYQNFLSIYIFHFTIVCNSYDFLFVVGKS